MKNRFFLVSAGDDARCYDLTELESGEYEFRVCASSDLEGVVISETEVLGFEIE